MITEEENNLLTQTGKGTPCGELMRRYWQPAALSEELAADKPLPVQLFGEELILFRDGDGKPALIGRYCAHQGVDMIYGQVEPEGLRCMYHGWLFDNCGKVVLRGDWLPEKERRWDVGQPAYPCVEAGGVILTYMGLGNVPAAPNFPFLFNSSKDLVVVRATVESNYLSAIESFDDPTGVSSVEATEGGLRIGAMSRFDEDRRRVQIQSFILPHLVATASPRARGGQLVSWQVPIDDRSHSRYLFNLYRKNVQGRVEPLILPTEANEATRQLLLTNIRELAEGREIKPAKASLLMTLSDIVDPRAKPSAKRRKAKS
jgi:nitrite reductase/ring-hydroxylating ferredoxin subunit